MEGLYKLEDYTFKRLLGEGMYSMVYLAEHVRGIFAVKVIPKGKHRRRGTTHAQKEIAALQRLSSTQGVASLKEWREDESSFFIVLLYCSGYPISSMPSFLSVQEIFYVGLSILETLNRMHLLGVYHLDLKPANVIVSAHGTYIIDFGCSFISSERVVELCALPFEGTPAYMAPEIIKRTESHISLEALDVWSFGCLLYYMSAGRDAFASTSLYSLYPKIIGCKINYAQVSDEIQQVCAKIFVHDPKARISLKSLISLFGSKIRRYA
ncbi:uncharacterized protein NEMAJ01_0299 [Nematocida major]|uniref:uncharacterized protein n=1 Tax=Nematocida major TaxID=1912982 RepID=UPI002008695A|nr:uncharacterized protein NEMAJ01_0299 [Nematocida major]KAH9385403.1 hypothetical protein NEMAJ01_0299 [Nematocida major]